MARKRTWRNRVIGIGALAFGLSLGPGLVDAGAASQDNLVTQLNNSLCAQRLPCLEPDGDGIRL